MPRSNSIPPCYTSRWKTGIAAHSPASPKGLGPSHATASSPGRKLNASCDGCRTSRVKCSGGMPCHRCAASAKSSACTYSISQRRGKHKARGHPSPALLSNVFTPAESQSDKGQESGSSLNDQTIEPTMFEPVSHPHDNIFNMNLGNIQNSFDPTPITAQSPSLSEFLNLLEPYDDTSPSAPTDRGTCSESCYLPVYSTTSKLLSLWTEKKDAPLESIIGLLDEATIHAAKYLACPNCDPGCARLVNLAMLHQRQMDRLCDIVKRPEAYLNEDAARLRLGAYQASRSDDAMLKRMLLLRITRDAASYMADFQTKTRGFEERFVQGTLVLEEAGRLTLRWLLDIAANLTKRLRCIQFKLEREDWGLDIL